MIYFSLVVRCVGLFVEYCGLIVILYAVLKALTELLRKKYTLDHIRKHLGKFLLTGLEVVIAGDIILATVVRDFEDILQLTGIVIIRAILEHAVQKEIEFKD